MIRYTPGFAPVADGVVEKVTRKNPTLPSVEKARALAAARDTQVLDYSRRKSSESPLKITLRTDGPTLEKWVEAGYPADKYPPDGYAELDSPALQVYKTTKTGLVDGKTGEPHTPHSVNDKPEVKP